MILWQHILNLQDFSCDKLIVKCSKHSKHLNEKMCVKFKDFLEASSIKGGSGTQK